MKQKGKWWCFIPKDSVHLVCFLPVPISTHEPFDNFFFFSFAQLWLGRVMHWYFASVKLQQVVVVIKCPEVAPVSNTLWLH